MENYKKYIVLVHMADGTYLQTSMRRKNEKDAIEDIAKHSLLDEHTEISNISIVRQD